MRRYRASWVKVTVSPVHVRTLLGRIADASLRGAHRAGAIVLCRSDPSGKIGRMIVGVSQAREQPIRTIAGLWEGIWTGC